jgi:hypothetical protein
MTGKENPEKKIFFGDNICRLYVIIVYFIFLVAYSLFLG